MEGACLFCIRQHLHKTLFWSQVSQIYCESKTVLFTLPIVIPFLTFCSQNQCRSTLADSPTQNSPTLLRTLGDCPLYTALHCTAHLRDPRLSHRCAINLVASTRNFLYTGNYRVCQGVSSKGRWCGFGCSRRATSGGYARCSYERAKHTIL